MKRRFIFGAAMLLWMVIAGDLHAATYDLTGTWNYTLSGSWASGGVGCGPGPAASGTCIINQRGDTFSFAYTSGVVCSPPESCTFEGMVAGSVYTASTTEIVDDEGGTATSTLLFTAASPTSASGSGTSVYNHPSGEWMCTWGNTIALTRADDGSSGDKYTLTVNTIGDGTVTLDPSGGIYDPGTIVEITAAADSGWQFTGWAGDVADSGAASTTVTMNADKTVAATFMDSGVVEVIDGGYKVIKDLWARSVLEVQGQPVTLVWKLVGADITPSGDQVISGYFYADPADFAYGSVYNPEVFVKIYISTNGWCNIAFNHVTVDDVTVDSAHFYANAPQQTWTSSLTNRLVEHQYNGVTIDTALQSAGDASTSKSDTGYTMASGLWVQAILQPVSGPVNLVWKEVGTDITTSGDKVVSGYFYADPADFAYGSVYNPEVFVKVYIASNGWANIAFNHVTVDDVSEYSAHGYSGAPDQTGNVTLNSRLEEHQYTGVSVK